MVSSGQFSIRTCIRSKKQIIDKVEIKRGAVLVRENSNGQDGVIYLPKSNLKLIGQGQVELLKRS